MANTTSSTATRLKAALLIAGVVAASAEGLRQRAYRDPVGILTVCYGSTTDVTPGKTYSLAECKARLDADMLSALEAVERCAPGLPPMTLAALGDAAYNIGPRIICDPKKSTLARQLKNGNVKAACEELPKWDKAKVNGKMVSLPGLTKRRALEKAMCLDGLAGLQQSGRASSGGTK